MPLDTKKRSRLGYFTHQL